MVHGMSQDHRVFDQQVEAFRGSYNIVLIDLPGHGLASGVAGPFGHIEFTRHVETVLDESDIGAVHYWGTHTGATVGLLLAARRPDLVRSLILEGPVVPGRNPSVVTDLVSEARAALAKGGISAARKVWWEVGVWFDYMRAHPVECRAVQQREIVDAFGGAPWADTSSAWP